MSFKRALQAELRRIKSNGELDKSLFFSDLLSDLHYQEKVRREYYKQNRKWFDVEEGCKCIEL